MHRAVASLILAKLIRMNPVAIESLPSRQRREAEEFLRTHPLSPAGRLRPRIGRNGAMWYALLGRDLHDGKVGFGATPAVALEAFNRNFGRSDGEQTASADA